MTNRKYDFDIMKEGEVKLIRCRVSERDQLLRNIRSLCSKYSTEGRKFKASPTDIGVTYYIENPKEPTTNV